MNIRPTTTAEFLNNLEYSKLFQTLCYLQNEFLKQSDELEILDPFPQNKGQEESKQQETRPAKT